MDMAITNASATQRVFVAITIATALTVPMRAQSEILLTTLTVPPQRLGSACRLSPSATITLDSSRMRGGLWAGLPIGRNPWQGTEPAAIVAIRQRLEVSTRPPDGPPLAGTELARFRVQLADEVEEAYAAIYTNDNLHLVTVYAVRFTELPDAHRQKEAQPVPTRFTRGRTVVAVAGDRGECSDAVAQHLKELIVR
jgi:hypothetical protein